MRPSHSVVQILRDYVNDHFDICSTNNVIFCHDIIYWLFTRECDNYFSHTYKSYRKRYKNQF